MDEVARRLKIEEIDYYNRLIRRSWRKSVWTVYREIAVTGQMPRGFTRWLYVDGKKSVEIAGMLNISQRTVEAQLYKVEDHTECGKLGASGTDFILDEIR